MPSRSPVGLVGAAYWGRRSRAACWAGFEVAGFDIDRVKNRALAELGGRPVGSVAELAAHCDPIVVAVFSTDQVEHIVEREMLPALAPGAGRIVLCASTCDPDRIARLAARVNGRGLRFLETPVSGSSGQVSRGEGVGLVGGDAEIVAAAAAVLRVMFPTYFHVGKVGDGGRAKLAINLILGLNRLALAEGLVFAERIGLDPRHF